MSTGNVLVPRTPIRSGNADSILAALWRKIVSDLDIDDSILEDRIDRYARSVTEEHPEMLAQVRGNLRTDVGKEAMTWYTFTKCLRVLGTDHLVIDFLLYQLRQTSQHSLQTVLDDGFYADKSDKERGDKKPNALCTFFKEVMFEQKIGTVKFEELLELFIRRTRLATQPDIKTKFRGYLRKDFYAPKMSWATLIKGFVFLCTTKLDMTVKLTGKSGRVTTHSYTLILSEKSDYYEEIENGKGI